MGELRERKGTRLGSRSMVSWRHWDLGVLRRLRWPFWTAWWQVHRAKKIESLRIRHSSSRPFVFLVKELS